MKKFYFSLIAASLFVTTAFAQGLTTVDRQKGFFQQVGPAFMSARISVAEAASKMKSVTASGMMKAKPRKADSENMPTTLIKDTPEGKLYKNMYIGGHCFMNNSGYAVPQLFDGYVSDAVEADDGSFYIYNPLGPMIVSSWIKGTKVKGEGGKPDEIVFKLPQRVWTFDDGTGWYVQSMQLSKNKADIDEIKDSAYVYGDDLMSVGIQYNGISKNNEIRFSWDGDTLKRLDNTILAATLGDSTWTGYGVDSIRVFNEKDVPTSLPATAKPVKMGLSYLNFNAYYYKMLNYPYTETSSLVRVAKDGNDIYIGDLNEGNDFWIKGTIKGDLVIFKKQYLGLDEKNGLFRYFAPVTLDPVYVEYGGQKMLYRFTSHFDDELKLEYDAVADSMTTDSAFVINGGKFYSGTVNLYAGAKFRAWEDKSYQPQDPTISALVPYDEEKGYGVFRFNLLSVDVDGNTLDPDQFFYRVFFDDSTEPYTFDPFEYDCLDEEMTDVPYNYADAGQQTFGFNGALHAFKFFKKDFKRIGVQGLYKGGNAEKLTAIVYTENPEAGIRTTGFGNETSVKSVTITDLSGRKVVNPVTGLYIKTVKYADGSVKSVKVIKK